MNVMLVLAARELGSLFRTPVGWIVLALYLFLTGLVFALNTLVPGEAATLRYFFGASAFLLVPIAPAVSMRLLADEYRSGTIEILSTTPLSEWSLALGKFAGAVLFLLVMLAPTLLYPVLLMWLSDPRPDPGPIATGYLGLILVGSLYIAIGLLASSITSSQTLAFLATLMFLILVSLTSTQIASLAPAPVAEVLMSLSIDRRVRDFAIGIVDTSHVVYFASLIGLFVTLAAGVLAMRRWR
ncbi:MAG: ABC transporter permease subunit [Phycisphaeraceae bacterium]|nr:ABC transporter permease subunit [Phycisphaeraceae bacterium]MCW5762325.1 ABC transporter permease subunit [Phycisphaeraceae bacterium]